MTVEETQVNSETEVVEDEKNWGEEETEPENGGEKPENEEEDVGDDEEHPSPKGVLEIPIMSSDSDHSSSSGSSGGGGGVGSERSRSFSSSSSSSLSPPTSSCSSEKGNHHGLVWKNLFGQIKKRSVKNLFLKKSLRRSHSAEDRIDSSGDDDFVVPKPSWRNFSYQELVEATDNFSPDKLVGKGGHAEVYKGCLPDGQVVAVKKITKKQKNDEDRVAEFLSELGIIAHIDHPNAAKLIGFSTDTGLHLVLQYLPRGSLATVLHGSGDGLEWKVRYMVAVGVAEGLQYLHCHCQRRIIHRDVTASNILLTEDYEPQISDFGLAKWLPDKWPHLAISPIEGTFGYMAPEYFMHGIVNEKIDVFAFGVLLLEIMTGRHAVDSYRQSLVTWAKPLLEKSNFKELADPRLGDNYDVIDMKRAIFTASACLHHLPNMRPNMKKVVQLLKGENEPVDMKLRSMGGRALLVDACDMEDYTCTTYLNDLNRHMQLIME